MVQRCMLVMLVFVLTVDAKAQPPAQPAVDRLGDSLPSGAVTRVGTLRFKHEPAAGAEIHAVVFSPDGTKIASLAGEDSRTIRLWDAVTGRRLPGPWTSYDRCTALAFSPDGSTIAAANARPMEGKGGDSILLWDIATAKLVGTLGAADFHAGQQMGMGLALAFADGGKTLVAAGRRGVRWWDIATAKEMRVWEPFAEKKPVEEWAKTFSNCALSPDGRSLAVVLRPAAESSTRAFLSVKDTSIRLQPEHADPEAIGFDLATGRPTWNISPTRPMPEDPSPEYRFAFSADGKRLAASYGPDKVAWRNAATGKLVAMNSIPARKVDQPDQMAFRLAVVEAGRRFVGGFIRFMELPPNYANNTLALFSDGNMTALVGSDGCIALCTSAEPNQVRWLPAGKTGSPGRPASAVAFSTDGKKMVVGAGPFLSVFDVATLKETVTCNGHDAAVDFVTFSGDGDRLVSASSAKDTGARNPLIWNTSNWDKLSLLAEPPSPLLSGGVSSPDKSLYALPGKDEGFSLFNQSTGKLVAALTIPKRKNSDENEGILVLRLGPNQKTTTTFFSPDSKYFVLTDYGQGGKRGQLVYSTSSGRLLCLLPAPGRTIETLRPLAFSDDGRLVATFSADDGKIHVFEIATGKLLQRMGIVPEDLANFSFSCNLAFSGAGKLLASWSAGDNVVRIWDVATGKQRCILPHDYEEHARLHLAWAPDGRMLALGDRKIQLWEIATLKVRREFIGHEGDIRSLAFSPDGRLLASGSTDTTVLIWDACGGR